MSISQDIIKLNYLFNFEICPTFKVANERNRLSSLIFQTRKFCLITSKYRNFEDMFRTHSTCLRKRCKTLQTVSFIFRRLPGDGEFKRTGQP